MILFSKQHFFIILLLFVLVLLFRISGCLLIQHVFLISRISVYCSLSL